MTTHQSSDLRNSPRVVSEEGGKLPPHSSDAEKAVLGCIFLSPESLNEALQSVSTNHFYELHHRHIWECFLELFEDDVAIDVVTVCKRLKDQQKLDGIGGVSYLSTLPDFVPSAANIKYYLDIVREKFLLRRAISVCTDMINRVYEFDGDLDEMLSGFESDVHALCNGNKKTERPIKELVVEAINRIQEYHENQGKLIGLPTGLADLDRLTWGQQNGQMIVIAARPSLGKAQPLSSQVLTPSGFVSMGSLKAGDSVIGRDGRPHVIRGIFPQGVKPVYRVKFSDGTSTLCCNEHLWFTQTRNERRRHIAGSVKTTEQITKTIRRSDGANRNHIVPLVSPVVFGPSGELPLKPWLLGALIGDGRLGCGSTCFFKPERDVQEKVISQLPAEDIAVPIKGGLRIKRKKRAKLVSQTSIAISALGLDRLSQHKFIPEIYLKAHPLDRLELLRGLLDTDGFVSGTCGTSVEYSTSSAQLMDDVMWLVRSLGGICKPTSRIPHFSYKGERKEGLRNYRAHIWFEDPSVIPVSSEKHIRKFKPFCRHVHKSIVSIKPEGEMECQCISIASDEGLYVTDDFIVTHNTSLMMQIAEHVAVDNKKAACVFSFETTDVSLTMRMICSRARVNIRKIKDGFLAERDFPKLTCAAGAISGAPIYIIESSGWSIRRLRSKAREMVSRYGVKWFGIDYLQLVAADKKCNSREQEVASISLNCKQMALELKVPVIVLSQLNRELEKTPDRKPRMSDLRESGTIEQDADVIGFLYKQPLKSGEQEDFENVPANLLIAKQKDGDAGIDINLLFRKGITRFESVARVSQEDVPTDYNGQTRHQHADA